MTDIHIVGGGLAGSEASLQLADRGYTVHLHDIKPLKTTPAHHNEHLAEIVCSNSFGSQGTANASGLLKLELEALNCRLLQIARQVSVPAGKALAVDREQFAETVTRTIQNHPNIRLYAGEVTHIPEDWPFTLIATGPLTTPALSETLSRLVNRTQLYFFDAASPILTRDSINFDIAFYQDRYGEEKGQAEKSYINCPLNREQYAVLLEKMIQGEKTPLKDFEKTSCENLPLSPAGGELSLPKPQYFESCLPIEVLASRGPETLRYGPMKPVGIIDPKTGECPYAVVQLRQDNAEGSLYNIVGFQTNLKWGAQKEMIQLIPGLEDAEVVRYGVMHRNTYIHSPEVLQPTLQLKNHPRIWIAGQLTGTEGYTESVATGLVAALNITHFISNKEMCLTFPKETMIGALLSYITRPEAIGKSFQPINSNWGILLELAQRERNKTLRNQRLAERALMTLNTFIQENSLLNKLLTL